MRCVRRLAPRCYPRLTSAGYRQVKLSLQLAHASVAPALLAPGVMGGLSVAAVDFGWFAEARSLLTVVTEVEGLASTGRRDQLMDPYWSCHCGSNYLGQSSKGERGVSVSLHLPRPIFLISQRSLTPICLPARPAEVSASSTAMPRAVSGGQSLSLCRTPAALTGLRRNHTQEKVCQQGTSPEP